MSEKRRFLIPMYIEEMDYVMRVLARSAPMVQSDPGEIGAHLSLVNRLENCKEHADRILAEDARGKP